MADDRIRLYMGTTGSGKTYLFCKHLALEKRVICFDTMADEKLEKWGVVCDSATDVIMLASKHTRSKNFHIRVQFDNPDRFEIICNLALSLGNCTIAVDELSLFCNSNWMPEGLRRIVRLGRHMNVRFMATTQRPADIQALILSQTKEAYVFQMHLPNDINYLGKFIPDLERAQTLQRGEYILWTPSQPTPTLSSSPPTSRDSVPIPSAEQPSDDA